MLPIVFFLKIIRAQTRDPVVVLSERALELTPLTEEIEAISGRALLRDVHFFAGLSHAHTIII